MAPSKDSSLAGGGTAALEEVQTRRKTDFAAPESPIVVVDESEALAPIRLPEEKEIKPGDTVAAHESHVLINSPEALSARIEAESGPDGLPADVVARRQHEEAAALEFGRISTDGQNARFLSGLGANQGADPEPDAKAAAVEAEAEAPKARSRSSAKK